MSQDGHFLCDLEMTQRMCPQLYAGDDGDEYGHDGNDGWRRYAQSLTHALTQSRTYTQAGRQRKREKERQRAAADTVCRVRACTGVEEEEEFDKVPAPANISV